MARVTGEPAREHIRNALMVLENAVSSEEEIEAEAQITYEVEDIDAVVDRLTWALDEIEKGNA